MENAYNQGVEVIDQIGPAIIAWIASRQAGKPTEHLPWWPALAPLNRAERAMVMEFIARDLAGAVTRVVPDVNPPSPVAVGEGTR